MTASLTIGDFSRATHLSVKTLRHYHHVGLLEPEAVDSDTGYRRYGTDQIGLAQVIRRFRDLDMPLDDIRAVLDAPDQDHRNELIGAHLRRLEQGLARTQQAVASLRALIERSPEGAIHHRRLPAAPAAAITDTVEVASLGPWFEGALGELRASLSAQGMEATGPSGGIYANELFTDERGEATVFVPVAGQFRAVGRVVPLVAPAVELAVIVHRGNHDDVDRSYGALARYVTDHALAVEGPLREYYLVDRHQTSDEGAWRTEICWPIFDTAAGSGAALASESSPR